VVKQEFKIKRSCDVSL